MLLGARPSEIVAPQWRLAAVTSTGLTLAVIPMLYYLWRRGIEGLDEEVLWTRTKELK